jgi:long-chain acyl-CoA synthetase
MHYLKRLENAIQSNWDNLSVCNFRGEQFTFGQFATSIEKMKILFEAIGIKKKDKIAICAKNSARWGITFFAINTYQAVVVPILADFHPDSVNMLVDHSESVVLFTDTDMWPKLDISKMPKIKLVLSTTDFSVLYAADEELSNICSSWDLLYEQKYPNGFSKEHLNYEIDDLKELALINYTSGTTSAPKGVMLRYECLDANVDFAQKTIPSSNRDKLVSMLPMAHMYGMMFELMYPLCGGTNIYYLGKTPTPSILLAALAEVKPYLLITVPLVMEKIFKNSILPKINTPAMKVLTKIPGINKVIFNKIRKTLLAKLGGNLTEIIMGGAALNPDVEKWFKRFKLPYTVGYGMTEAAPLMAYADWREFVPKSCGKALDCVEIRIDSEDPQNVVGQIQARGRNIMSGYFKNEEATKAAFTEDGWMNTGDLGIIDKNGNIFIKGRSKSMILTSNGQNIYPEELEALLNNQAYIIESVVIDRKGVIVALIYLDVDKLNADGIKGEDVTAKVNEIVQIVNKALPVYSKISKFEVVAQPFEKTPKMSIKRFLYK